MGVRGFMDLTWRRFVFSVSMGLDDLVMDPFVNDEVRGSPWPGIYTTACCCAWQSPSILIPVPISYSSQSYVSCAAFCLSARLMRDTGVGLWRPAAADKKLMVVIDVPMWC